MTLAFHGCTFGYRRRQPVFEGLDMSFEADATVLLGPNGAGKSTLLSLAATVLRPWSGTVEFGGLRSGHARDLRTWRRRVAWLPQSVAAVPGLKVREQVAFAGWLKGDPRRTAWDRSRRALERVGLDAFAEHPSHALSGGQLRRLGIAQTLVHDAELVLMDEPTAGLDPLQRAAFRELLGSLAGEVRVIVSTHQTEDLGELYQEVVLIDGGRVRFQSALHDFLARAPEGVPRERAAEHAYAGLVSGEL